MNGFDFLCFMEENKRRQRGGEKGALSAHTHRDQPQRALVAGVARQHGPIWLAWLFWSIIPLRASHNE